MNGSCENVKDPYLVAGYLYFVDQGMRLRSSACVYSSWRMNDPYLARGMILAGVVVVSWVILVVCWLCKLKYIGL
jgi:hypothetical protein